MSSSTSEILKMLDQSSSPTTIENSKTQVHTDSVPEILPLNNLNKDMEYALINALGFSSKISSPME